MRISDRIYNFFHPFNRGQPAADASKESVIKSAHATQLNEFEGWAAAHEWGKIKHAHYDWWMFPVNRDSSAHGSTYTVNEHDIQALKRDPEFMRHYKRGVELVVQAWGWDLEVGRPIANPSADQCWDGYGVRLAKMSDSLKLFGEVELHNKLKKFFVDHCLPLQKQIRISDLPWLLNTFNHKTERT